MSAASRLQPCRGAPGSAPQSGGGDVTGRRGRALRGVAAALVVVLLVPVAAIHGPTVGRAAGQTNTPVDICDRTAAVRDALLEEVDAVNCALVPPGELAAITELNLERQGIATLKAGDFDDLGGLSDLVLEYNDLTTLPDGIFDELHGLRNLVLEENDFTTLPAGIFDELEGLTHLDLCGNELESLPESIFDELTNLTHLNLYEVHLTTLPEGLLENLVNLEELLLYNNSEMVELPVGVFANLRSLEHLEMHGNSLSTLPKGVFANLGSLEHLDMHGNSLSTLPAGVFGGLDSLEELDLHYNGLTSLPEGVFDGLGSLKVLWLDANALESLPEGVFAGLASLENLTMPGNRLTGFAPGVFRALVSLKRLEFAGQDETWTSGLPAGIFDGLTSLTSLSPGNLHFSPYLLDPLVRLDWLWGPYSRPSRPGPPTGLAASFTPGSIELRWTPPPDGPPADNEQRSSSATSYQVVRSVVGGGDEEVLVADNWADWTRGGEPRSYTDTDVVDGERYLYEVRSLNAGGMGAAASVEILARLMEEGPLEAAVDEGESLVADYSTGSSASGVVWSLSGVDSGVFVVVGGALRFAVAPDYESPADAGGDNVYEVEVGASAGGRSEKLDVTVTVANVDEDGVVSMSPVEARVGTVLRASLVDPDGAVSGVTWQWESSEDQSSWTPLGGGHAGYTPGDADLGRHIRARASYSDGEGPAKGAAGSPQGAVGARAASPGVTALGLVSGLTIPWDVAFTPDGAMLFTERGGTLSRRLVDGTVAAVAADFGDLFAVGKTGLMGVAVDPGFESNRRFYTCQGHQGPEVQVVAWTIDEAYSEAVRVADPLVGGLPAAGGGRHGGCRLRFGPQGHLWIATGDAAKGTVPQDLGSLGGKVLRVDASSGEAAAGNPGGSRVYSFGHRNVQGLARRPGTAQMWSVEHGPSVDDEINLLVAGGNYGWDPAPGYDESVPMTDLEAFPAAVEASWSSGDPTLAVSGGVFLGDEWDEWAGRLAVAALKARQLHVFEFTSSGVLVSQVVVAELDGAYGRLRTPVVGPDGALYVTTSNGGGRDSILRVVPSVAPEFPGGTDTQEVPENRPVSAVVATVAAGDPDGDALAYTLDGPDAARFAIDATGRLRARATLDHEHRASYVVAVTATDRWGLSDTVTVTISRRRRGRAPDGRGPHRGVPLRERHRRCGRLPRRRPRGGLDFLVAGGCRRRRLHHRRRSAALRARPRLRGPRRHRPEQRL